jgi:hypothetical protein
MAKETAAKQDIAVENAIDHTDDRDVDKRRRRRAKEDRRRAKKLADRLAALGLDETGEPLDNYSLLKYPVREWKFKVPGGSAEDIVAINPVVTLLCVVALWALVAWNTRT